MTRVLGYALLPGVVAASLLRTARRVDSNHSAGYDPVEILCLRGKEKPEVAGWCKDWLTCIRSKATPAESPASVKAAWGPADCKEVCGKWPAAPKKASLIEETKALNFLTLRSRDDCIKSCENFQTSLSTCVATIMFEEGKVAAMGLPKGAPKGGAICTKKDSPCVPDLPIRHQKCLTHRTAKVLDHSYEVADDVAQTCKLLSEYMGDCKDCPQLSGEYASHYVAFTGGCMDQLNAYWAATNSKEAGKFALPSGKGCEVH